MKVIEIYEPAMCCPTGVCGPSVDSELLTITAITKEVNSSETSRIYRRNLTQNPAAFARSEIVKQQIQDKGIEILPITLVDGELYDYGEYPTVEEIERITGLEINSTTQN
ncbi:arsenite efflux transporter metallochaperone ArsD [Lactobacillus sp. YT155]|uniref:arsenite efflux transporter metallochaperone ArsD n=1 Tax=Lactobacillus sp. YT155 TaxID=3060955 RepID=UPI00265EADA9|nr:arsenite efflux transporter metallochaperone ArsD [Lactobacillus sp. YT155]MDO1604784.1 arsenite efflux transporter metallochaperone ArsD [Lactobacillus sp. YT155]